MASGSGRYQSKVFSFFSQQSLRWRDKAGQALRQAQVAALWSLQILLYPVYTTFQTTRLVSRQIGRSVRQVIPQLQAAKTALTQTEPHSTSVDAPLQQTLAALPSLLSSLPDSTLLDLVQQTIESPIEPSAETALTQATPLAIQGIASQLDTGDLVLITATNQVVDILTAEQQAYLHRQIVWEVADYGRQQRLQRSRSSHTLLPLISDRPKAWQPIRVFYRLMAWMQTSPVALATNLFQESQAYLEAVDRGVIAALPSHNDRDDVALRSATPTWSSLDELFSDLPPAPQSDPSSDPQILSRLQTSLMEIAQRSAQLASQLLQKSGLVLYNPPTPTHSSIKTGEQFNLVGQTPVSQTPLGIEQLRQKLFDRLNSHLQVQEPIQVKSTPGLPTASQTNWETFDPTQSRTLAPANTAVKQEVIKKNIAPGKRWGVAASASSTAIAPFPASSIAATEEYPACTIVPQSVMTSIQPGVSETESSALAAPTYIEAEVKLVQYVKHPLEQVLEWLDLGMLWIEKRLAEMVKWLSDRMR